MSLMIPQFVQALGSYRAEQTDMTFCLSQNTALVDHHEMGPHMDNGNGNLSAETNVMQGIGQSCHIYNNEII